MARDHQAEGIVRDQRGSPLFRCSLCGAPLTVVDFGRQALRCPESGETAQDYLDAEVIDELSHYDCVSAAREAV
jgi:hypothetical protein